MRVRAAIIYSVLRLLAFLVPFAVMMLFPVFRELYWLAAIFAALIGLSLSVLFLRRPLTEATAGLGEGRPRRDRPRRWGAADAASEDPLADQVLRDVAAPSAGDTHPENAQNRTAP